MTDAGVIGGIVFYPLVPVWVIGAFALVGVLLIALAVLRGGKAWGWRIAALAFIAVALADPRIARENRIAETDIGLLIIDESASQRYGDRTALSETAAIALTTAAEGFDDLDMRVVRVTPDKGSDGTRLYRTLNEQAALIPKDRFAGAVLITDGQVHDVPMVLDRSAATAPVHVLLSGTKGETDRRLIIDGAPGYAIVDTPFTIELTVDDAGVAPTGTRVVVTISREGVPIETVNTRIGATATVEVSVSRAGPTVFEASVEPLDGEVSALNNRALVTVNGVRDRLRVLLVSGQPHNGERTWRNLLKSDPAVDLVHFTILRPPEKDDFTPLNELALITFPVQELFEEKLEDFDLIIFDRYIVRDVLPPSYMRNIALYLEEGGALLFADGPELAGLRSLYRTPLGEIMPVVPTGEVIEQPFRPTLSDDGARHPVTADLRATGGQWGRWFRQIEGDVRRGHVVMTGVDGRPLMVLDRFGEGRVAQILSDQIWLWARGFEGGGPHAETLRRMAHWLMREPDLEEEALTAQATKDGLLITQRSMGTTSAQVTVTLPDGSTEAVPLVAETPNAPALGRFETDAQGLFTINDGTLTTRVALGARNPLEIADLRAVETRLRPLAAATGGSVTWLTAQVPTLRRVDADRNTAGRGWIGLTRGGVSTVRGVVETPLMPGWLLMVLGVGLTLLAWRRESR